MLTFAFEISFSRENGMDNYFLSNYGLFYHRALMFVNRYVADRGAAEDIVSDVMVKLWRTLDTDEVESPQSLLYVMLRNAMFSYFRRQKHTSSEKLDDISLRYELLESSAEDLAELDDIYRKLDATLDSLPEKTAQVFRMSRMQGMSNHEIALALGLTDKAVEYHIHKALVVLRRALRDYLPFNLFLLTLLR